MNLSFRPMAWIKTLAVSASVVTMCMTPLALGAEAQNQKQMVNEFLKTTGLGSKNITVGEYWQKVRHVYPESMRKDVDVWVSLNRNELMPKVEVNTYKDRNGQEQLRISLSKDGQVVTLTNTGDDDKNIKINSVSFSKDQVFNHRLVAKTMAEKDPTVKKALQTGRLPVLSKKIVMTYKEYARLNPRQKAEYLVRLRTTVEAAQRVYTSVYGQQAMNDFDQQHQYATNWAADLIFGSEANAAGLTGKPCVVAGYLSVYGENQSCGGSKTGADDLSRKMAEGSASCSGNAVACNPMVYGFDSGGGAYCVPRGEIKYATRVCNQKSPLRKDNPRSEGEDKKRIIESYLKKVKGQDINLVLNEEGKISQDQFNQISAYLGDLQQYIDSAIAECDSLPLAAIQKSRPDQVSACNEIRVRAFSLQSFIANPQPGPTPQPPPVPPVPVRDCELEMIGSALSEDGKSCVCPANSKPGKMSPMDPAKGKKGDEEIVGHDRQACVQPGIVVENDDSNLAGSKPSPIKGEDSCGFWCRNKNWIIGGGIFLGIFALLALFMKKKKTTTPTYVPPVAVEPTPLPKPTPTVPPAPTLPPAPTCNAPNMWVGGVCTPPTITPIPTHPPASEGGTKPDSTQGGGVR